MRPRPAAALLCAALAACAAPARPVAAQGPSPWFEPPPPPPGQEPLYVVQLLADPATFPILQKYIPEYLAFLEQQVTPAPPSDFTLDDFRHTTGTQVTNEDIAAIKAELARIGWRP